MPPPGRKTYREFYVGIVGQRGSGKTSIVNRVFEQYFIEDEDIEYDPTYDGPPRRTYVIDRKDAILDSWEFTEEPGENLMSKIAAIKCDGFLMVFSLTDTDSFEKLRFYHKAILDARDQKSFHAIIIGNKCDITRNRVVDKQEAEAVAQDLGYKYFEISAKEDINVDDAMRELVREKWRQEEIATAAAVAASAAELRGEPGNQRPAKGKFKLLRGMRWMQKKLRGPGKS